MGVREWEKENTLELYCHSQSPFTALQSASVVTQCWRESRRAEKSPGWLRGGMACWEVSRRSGITGQTVGGKETGRGVWARKRPCRGHAWVGTLSESSSCRCRRQLLETNGIDSWQGDQPLPGPTHHHSFLPQWHPSLFLPRLPATWLHVVMDVRCSLTIQPANFNCSMYL